MKEERSFYRWLAVSCVVANAASVALPFVSGRDPVETFVVRTFHGLNLQEVSWMGAGVMIAPMIWLVLLFSRLPYRDKVWLWVCNIVFQSICYPGALGAARQWLWENTVDVELGIGVAAYPVLAAFAAALVFWSLHAEENA